MLHIIVTVLNFGILLRNIKIGVNGNMYQNEIVMGNEFVTVIEKFAIMPDKVRLYTKCLSPYWKRLVF